ncbi:tripartite tricarboxylate transporter TctB family protein [Ensifer adhaerens]|uniref:tripartite tricarboxylate transporter TctB family protein n=1 Tax=Ensifer adhaerens TaxID=106592 RepID=UPI0023A96920|nr:tripartite tricarboxylate transporter TctB family protein [Ensifer adhaerens]WDZ76231.1 tripartite tricarboxylate transporter TctB family protein [Ensifer adhaerens]
MQQREHGLGLIYLVFGTAGLIGGLSYPIGSFSRMGPGFLPVAVSLIILGFAAISFMRGFARGQALKPVLHPNARQQARAMFLLMLSMLTFVVGCRLVGLFPTVALMMFVGALASADFRFSPKLLAGLLIVAFGFSFIFVRVLGLPLPLIRLPF